MVVLFAPSPISFVAKRAALPVALTEFLGELADALTFLFATVRQLANPRREVVVLSFKLEDLLERSLVVSS